LYKKYIFLAEKNEKYRELRTKEKQIDEYLDSFDANRIDEMNRIEKLQDGIVKLLKIISKNYTQHDMTTMMTGIDEFDLKGGFGIKSIDAASVQDLQDGNYNQKKE
jgi:hypothetical protein